MCPPRCLTLFSVHPSLIVLTLVAMQQCRRVSIGGFYLGSLLVPESKLVALQRLQNLVRASASELTCEESNALNDACPSDKIALDV